ncbi:hypothetical protein BGW39_000340, partial [Mortierella sp. 14UC]
MHTTTFSGLPPEVQELIGAYFNQQDWSACVGVCREWRALFLTYLWRDIDIDCNRLKAWQDTFSKALETNHHLVRSLKLRSVDNCVDLGSFIECCPPTFPRLTSAEIESSRDLGLDSLTAAFIGLSSPGWKRLVFRKTPGSRFQGPFQFSTESFEALCKHTSTLEVFRMEAKSYVLRGHIDRLLCLAPLLKELYFTTDQRDFYGGWIDADKIVDSDWVCNNLEVFACEIGHIRRLDITRDINPNFSGDFIYRQGTHEESIDLQRRIYSKLAKFTKLRVLKLGIMIDPAVQDYRPEDKEICRRYDSLAMTVESGLDLLKGLKELRVVDLSDLEVYVDGEPEQSWFKEHWPLATVITTSYLDDAADQGSLLG